MARPAPLDGRSSYEGAEALLRVAARYGIGAVVVPVLVSLDLGGDAGEVVSWTTVVVSLVVAMSAALEEFFKFGERWRHYRRTVERLKAEGWLFFELVGEYVSPNGHAAAFPRFAAESRICSARTSRCT